MYGEERLHFHRFEGINVGLYKLTKYVPVASLMAPHSPAFICGGEMTEILYTSLRFVRLVTFWGAYFPLLVDFKNQPRVLPFESYDNGIRQE